MPVKIRGQTGSFKPGKQSENAKITQVGRGHETVGEMSYYFMSKQRYWRVGSRQLVSVPLFDTALRYLRQMMQNCWYLIIFPQNSWVKLQRFVAELQRLAIKEGLAWTGTLRALILGKLRWRLQAQRMMQWLGFVITPQYSTSTRTLLTCWPTTTQTGSGLSAEFLRFYNQPNESKPLPLHKILSTWLWPVGTGLQPSTSSRLIARIFPLAGLFVV